MTTDAHDHPPAFVSAEYDLGHAGLEVWDAGGTGGAHGGSGGEEGAWRGATVYTHWGTGSLVLWFGGDEYEGIGGSYRWCPGGRGAEVAGAPCGPRLLDSDGDVVPTRAAPPKKGGTGLPALTGGGAAATPALAVQGRSSAGLFLPFEEAVAVVRGLGLKTQAEWGTWCKSRARAANIPTNPHTVYRHAGWQGYGHWLGTGTVASINRAFLPIEEALVFMRSLQLKSAKEWLVWCKSGARPTNIPGNPHKAYAHAGWQGMGHWLGTGTVASINKVFLPFEEALVFVRSLKLKSRAEWKAWSKSGARAASIPGCPEKTYAHDGWQGIGHWLGTYTQQSGRRGPPTHAPAAVAGTAHLPHQRPSRKRSATSQAVSSSKQPAAARAWD